MKKLYFVRHGESEFNRASVWVGGTSDSQLTETGKKQAKAGGQHLKKNKIKIDLIISSPLGRASETAKLVAHEIDYPVEKIQISELLVERDFGSIDGKMDVSREETYRRDESSIDSLAGVEKLVDLQKRADAFVEYLNSLPQDSILVVSHGGIGRAIRRSLRKEPLSVRGEPFKFGVIEELI